MRAEPGVSREAEAVEGYPRSGGADDLDLPSFAEQLRLKEAGHVERRHARPQNPPVDDDPVCPARSEVHVEL